MVIDDNDDDNNDDDGRRGLVYYTKHSAEKDKMAHVSENDSGLFFLCRPVGISF